MMTKREELEALAAEEAAEDARLEREAEREYSDSEWRRRAAIAEARAAGFARRRAALEMDRTAS